MVYEFGEFSLDTKRHELRRGGEPQHLEPQVYAVLCHLLEHRDRLVTSKELIERVWGDRFVTPGTLNSRIKALRQALGDDGATQRMIQTVHGRGFRVGIAVRIGRRYARSERGDCGEQQRRSSQAADFSLAELTTACGSHTRKAATSGRRRW